MPRDSIEDALAWSSRLWERAKRIRSPLRATAERRGLGLSAKLLLLTVSFVMLAEVLIFVPSVANFRITWLNDRLTAAQLAALAAEAVPGGVVPDALRSELLRTAQVRAVALKRSNERRLVLPADAASQIDDTYDFRASARASGFGNELALRLRLIWDALSTFWARDGRTIRVIGEPGMGAGDFIEVVLPEAPLKAAMIRYGLNVLGLSVIISVITAALVYFALNGLLVQPMMRIARNMLRFGQNPEDASRIIVPSPRRDEIGTAERELAHMQGELTQTLQQKSRLAALGLAVSKINHDLRNMLANAQLISDRLSSLSDPAVQRFAPKLIASLDRAINLANSTLKFGRAEEAPPRRELMPLRPLVEEVGDGLGLPREGAIDWTVEVDTSLRVDADRDQLFRVLSNLTRNAMQAIEQQENVGGQIRVAALREGVRVTIEISDDGPGVPEKARAHLFQAFQGSARKGGTGLGLAVAQELINAHGGVIRLRETPKGATFELEIPDRADGG
ncbi:MAG TPA: HAMP domain-containing sensor histidine kinase [Hyphomicrobiaceae bacterium]|nr:HAMP domain-containing sensor histidine kinase [Hyphomicrobiaceae bacterium]